MTGQQFPALSVRQPWAELIVTGRKAIEIRTWERAYRGRIWIHAARHVDEALEHSFDVRNPYRGGFIGSAELVSIEPLSAENWDAWRKYHLDPGEFRSGQFAWVLVNPRKLAVPIAVAGSLGLYDLNADLHGRLVAAETAGTAAHQ